MEQIYTLEEAADILKCSHWTLYQMVKNKEIPHFRVGNRIRFSESGLTRYKNHQEKKNCKY